MPASSKQIAIIGGGAAGFFAAANLANTPGIAVAIYDTNSRFLTKVEVSGGGRCNVTHNCFDTNKLVASYPRGGRELIGPFSRFQPKDTISWFEERGVQLKAEPDGRMFPVTDSSQTIIECLMQHTNDGIGTSGEIALHSRIGVKSITKVESGFELALSNDKTIIVDTVLLATGSSKSGHALAASLGHTVTDLVPSLFTFKSEDTRLLDLSGVSFPNAQLTLATGKKTFKQQGPLLITHWGLSGPAVLKLSAFAARELSACDYQAQLLVNWIGGIPEEECRLALASLRSSAAKKEIASNPQFFLTRRFWERLLAQAHIPFNLHCSELSNSQIHAMVQLLTRSDISITGKGEFKEEFVTCGGVRLKEIDFRTMESKLVPNLFFAGEILDIDGITGGFNFQAAWSGGWLAAQELRQRFAPVN